MTAHLHPVHVALGLEHFLEATVNGGCEGTVVSQLFGIQLLVAINEGQVRLGCHMRLTTVLLKVLLHTMGAKQQFSTTHEDGCMNIPPDHRSEPALAW